MILKYPLFLIRLIKRLIKVTFFKFLSFFFIRKEGKWPIPKDSIKKILVIRNDYLGDMVVFLPTLIGIREGFPKANLYLWTSPIAKELISGSNLVDKFIIFDVQRLKKKNLIEILKLIRVIRKEKFDLLISTSLANFSSQFIGFLSGAPYRLGFDSLKIKYFFNKSIKYDPNNNDREENLKILDALEIEYKDKMIDTDFWPQEKDRLFIKEFLEKNGIHKDDVCFGLNIGTKQPANRWLAKRWAELIKKIKKKFITKIILFGSQEDVVYKEEVFSYLNNNEKVIDSVGKLNIKQLSLLIKRCNLFVSHDSGAVHLSVSLGVPTVVLFGKSNPYKWGYLENKNYSVIQKPVACRPCGKIECKDNICMKLISVEDVLKSIEELIIKNYGKIKN